MKQKPFIIGAIIALCLLAGCSSESNSVIKTQQPASTNEDFGSGNNEQRENVNATSDEQNIISNVLNLLYAYKNSDYSDASSIYEDLGTQYVDARSSLGDDHRITRILNHVCSYGLFEGIDNVVDMAIDILTYDTGDLSVAFVGESQYLFNDCRYHYDSVYPVCDLSTGCYGVYDLSTKQYIYEPTLSYLSGPDDQGYICLCYNGYYGCINMQGEKVIGFMYDEPISFEGQLATVKTNKQYGVIDNAGNILLNTKYAAVHLRPEHQIIIADFPENGVTSYAIFGYNGNALTGHWYDSIKFQDNRIYAHWNKTQQNTVDSESGEVYDLLDYYGTRLIGEGTDLPDIWGVKLPDSHGIMVAECHGNVTNSYGVSYPHQELSYGKYYCFTYLTANLKPLNGNFYRNHYANDLMTGFNQKGYAIATVGTEQRGSDSVDVLLFADGRELEVLPVVDHDTIPVDANDYVFKMFDTYTYTSQAEIYGVYIRATDEFIPYRRVELVDGTNLTIVQDAETQLYGLYDGDELVLSTVYNAIVLENGQVLATRGAEEITYQARY